jgi:hypothetical protein
MLTKLPSTAENKEMTQLPMGIWQLRLLKNYNMENNRVKRIDDVCLRRWIERSAGIYIATLMVVYVGQ